MILIVVTAMMITLAVVEHPKPSLGTTAQLMSQCSGWGNSPTAAPTSWGEAGGAFSASTNAESFSKGSFRKESIPNEFVASSRNYSSGC